MIVPPTNHDPNQTGEFGKQIQKKLAESRYLSMSLLLHLVLLTLLGGMIVFQRSTELHDFIADGGSGPNGLMGQGEDGSALTSSSDALEPTEEELTPPENLPLTKVDIVTMNHLSVFEASLAHPEQSIKVPGRKKSDVAARLAGLRSGGLGMGSGSGAGVGSGSGGGGERRGLCTRCGNPTCKFSQFYFHKVQSIAIRLTFKSWSDDAALTGAKVFQVETPDFIPSTITLKLGDLIPNTSYKLISFTLKKSTSSDGAVIDTSDLNIAHAHSDNPLTLPLNQTVQAAEDAAIFKFNTEAGMPPKSFSVFINGEFSLPGALDKKYKLKDIRNSEAVVQTPLEESIVFRKAG